MVSEGIPTLSVGGYHRQTQFPGQNSKTQQNKAARETENSVGRRVVFQQTGAEPPGDSSLGNLEKELPRYRQSSAQKNEVLGTLEAASSNSTCS